MIDPVWEEKYSQGHAERYPWDSVVSFVFRNAPRNRPRSEVHILEVGFGSGSNLWFAAREGFSVLGVEGSTSAVAYAKNRFRQEGLEGDLRVGDFTELPFADDTVDLAIDRSSLVCVGRMAQKRAVAEIYRVLKKGGLFHYNGYADSHSSARSGETGADGVRVNISEGTLVGAGQLCFQSRSGIDELFGPEWKLRRVERREWVDMLGATASIHAEWLVVAEKAGG